MQALIPLSCKASRNQSASQPLSASSQLGFGQTSEQRQRPAIAADLAITQKEPDQAPVHIGNSMKFGVQPAFHALNETTVPLSFYPKA